MAERSLLGLSGTEIPFNVALGLPSDGCCGDMSFWMSTHTQTCQVASPGNLLQHEFGIVMSIASKIFA